MPSDMSALGCKAATRLLNSSIIISKPTIWCRREEGGSVCSPLLLIRISMCTLFLFQTMAAPALVAAALTPTPQYLRTVPNFKIVAVVPANRAAQLSRELEEAISAWQVYMRRLKESRYRDEESGQSNDLRTRPSTRSNQAQALGQPSGSLNDIFAYKVSDMESTSSWSFPDFSFSLSQIPWGNETMLLLGPVCSALEAENPTLLLSFLEPVKTYYMSTIADTTDTPLISITGEYEKQPFHPLSGRQVRTHSSHSSHSTSLFVLCSSLVISILSRPFLSTQAQFCKICFEWHFRPVCSFVLLKVASLSSCNYFTHCLAFVIP